MSRQVEGRRDAYYAARFGGQQINTPRWFCRYPSDIDSKAPVGDLKFQQVDFTGDPTIPCNDITSDSVPRIDLRGSQVPLASCLAQRREGLCPRDFGLNPTEKLQKKP